MSPSKGELLFTQALHRMAQDAMPQPHLSPKDDSDRFMAKVMEIQQDNQWKE